MNRDEGDLLFVVVVGGTLLYLLSGVLVRGWTWTGSGTWTGKVIVIVLAGEVNGHNTESASDGQLGR